MKSLLNKLRELKIVDGLDIGSNSVLGKHEIKITITKSSINENEMDGLYSILRSQNEFEWTINIIP